MKLNDWNIKDTSYTISFVGKSNVGKSSIINIIFGIRNLILITIFRIVINISIYFPI